MLNFRTICLLLLWNNTLLIQDLKFGFISFAVSMVFSLNLMAWWFNFLLCSVLITCFCRAAGWRWNSHKYFFPPVQTAIWCGPLNFEHVHGEWWAPDCQGSQSVLVYNFCAFQLKHIKPRFIWTVFFAPLYFACCNLNIKWLTNRVRWSLATSSVRGKDGGKFFF